MMFNRFASEQNRMVGKVKTPLQMSFVDIRKAYFNGIPRRSVYMDFPREMGLGKDVVAKQVRCVYGTRDASSIWEDCYRDALEDLGFTSGAASPCVFFNKDRNITIVVHGDDFNALGVAAELDWYETELAKHFEIKIRGRMGPGGDCTEIKILNRILRLTPEGLTYEADPRHVDLLASSMNLDASKGVGTPGVKDPVADYAAAATKHNEPLVEPRIEPSEDGGAINYVGDSDVQMSVRKLVQFDLNTITTYPVTPYSEIYGCHPRRLKTYKT